MYLNCKYPYYHFKKFGEPGMPFLGMLCQPFVDETDPVLKVKESNEYLKAKLKHKRFGTPLPVRQFTFKYTKRIIND